ncbi:transcription initiation factor TFIID subunit 7 [Podospora fimiseda]|uniref:Transcription initiation factor TFIID subunit 7 n=1 Tax=Podospora fimiseda TaxID=252190 RepID=A0AAN6YSM0_9PEZI|nr:transcription initiation factor TFIID subunit 7 [Podospora fimiseda]
MSQPAPSQPSLKVTLKIGGGSSHGSRSPQPAISPAPQSASGFPKIKVVSRSQPPTPADQNPPPLPTPSFSFSQDAAPTVAPPPSQITTKAGRKPKPTAKKRARDDSDDDDVPLANSTPNGLNIKNKKIKIAVKTGAGGGTKPIVKLRSVGKIPPRPSGEGYDSEAEDAEPDPVHEEEFIFRMMSGEHCEYIRKMIQEKKIGIPKANGGADLSLKWLDDEGRRAMVVVLGQPYAAILVDLPTITEGMKTWDKKSMVKTADICQMLLVFAKVQSEEEARTVPLPKTVEHGHRWPHGITPPMHDARNRRFRKRLSKLEIQNKEAEVERLLAADREADNVRIEWIENKPAVEADSESEEEYEEDAEGEEEFEMQTEDVFGDDVDESALLEEFMNAAETPADGLELDIPVTSFDAFTPITANTGTPAAQTDGEEADGVGDEESEEDEEDGDDDGDDGDDDEGDHDETAGVRAEIADLKKQLKAYEDQLAKSGAPIIRKRIEGSIRNVKSEILLKMSSIGLVEED